MWYKYLVGVGFIISVLAGDLMSRLKTFTLSLEVICAAVETLCQLGYSDDIKQTQVGLLCLHLQCSCQNS